MVTATDWSDCSYLTFGFYKEFCKKSKSHEGTGNVVNILSAHGRSLLKSFFIHFTFIHLSAAFISQIKPWSCHGQEYCLIHFYRKHAETCRPQLRMHTRTTTSPSHLVQKTFQHTRRLNRQWPRNPYRLLQNDCNRKTQRREKSMSHTAYGSRDVQRR